MNALAFALRSRVAFRRGRPELRNESDKGFDFVADPERTAVEQRALELEERYALAPLRACSTRLDYGDNLALLDALERVVGDHEVPFGQSVRAVDIGSKNWSYVYGQTRFLQRIGHDADERFIHLDGVEIDGHGIYADGYSRADYASAYVHQSPSENVHYHVEDILVAAVKPCDLVFNLFPFVQLEPLLCWGLPQRMFQPDRLIARSVELLKPGGWLIVFNQTKEERDTFVELLEGTPGKVLRSVPIATKLVRYGAATRHRWGTLATV